MVTPSPDRSFMPGTSGPAEDPWTFPFKCIVSGDDAEVPGESFSCVPLELGGAEGLVVSSVVFDVAIAAARGAVDGGDGLLRTVE
jgi:hypothetical protein